MFCIFHGPDHEGERTGPYGNMPIRILSAEETQAARGRPRDLLRVGDQMQEELKGLSTRSRRIIVKGRGHRIQEEWASVCRFLRFNMAAVMRSKSETPSSSPTV
jgi:hypothetical protein